MTKPWSGTTEELRTWLEAQLRITMPDQLWTDLQDSEESWIDQARGSRQGRDDLLRHLRRQKRMWLQSNRPRIAGRPPKSAHDEAARGLLTELEHVRADVVSRYIARLAVRDSGVRELWASHFEGAPLEPVHAKRILSSPATASLPRAWYPNFQAALEHSQLVREVRTESQWRRTLKVDGRRVIARNPSPAQLESAHETMQPMGDMARSFLEPLLIAPSESTLSVELPESDSSAVHELAVWPGSFLDDIRKTAVALSQDYDWSPAAAAWFVLTGATPQVWPFGFSVQGPTTSRGYQGVQTVLRVDPWVSGASVQRIYKWLQNYAGRKGGKSVTEKGLRLFDFVSERRITTDAPPAWPELWRQWNAQYPAEKYVNYRRMWETYTTAERALVVPPAEVADNQEAKEDYHAQTES